MFQFLTQKKISNDWNVDGEKRKKVEGGGKGVSAKIRPRGGDAPGRLIGGAKKQAKKCS